MCTVDKNIKMDFWEGVVELQIWLSFFGMNSNFEIYFNQFKTFNHSAQSAVKVYLCFNW